MSRRAKSGRRRTRRETSLKRIIVIGFVVCLGLTVVTQHERTLKWPEPRESAPKKQATQAQKCEFIQKVINRYDSLFPESVVKSTSFSEGEKSANRKKFEKEFIHTLELGVKEMPYKEYEEDSISRASSSIEYLYENVMWIAESGGLKNCRPKAKQHFVEKIRQSIAVIKEVCPSAHIPRHIEAFANSD